MLASTTFRDIEGYFGENCARFYRHQVQIAPEQARFVEVGSFRGRSAYCMAAEIQRTGKQISLCCVDTWKDYEGKAADPDVHYQAFLANTAPFKAMIQAIRKPSLDAAGGFSDGSLDFVFLDAAHDYESVHADIQAWRPKVKASGIIAGHDYSKSWPGVARAVHAVFGDRAHLFGSCWAFSETCQSIVPFYLPEYCQRAIKKLKRSWRREAA